MPPASALCVWETSAAFVLAAMGMKYVAAYAMTYVAGKESCSIEGSALSKRFVRISMISFPTSQAIDSDISTKLLVSAYLISPVLSLS